MYAAYHRDHRNQLTHHVGVPLIVFALLLALAQVPLTEANGYPITAATVFLSVLLLIYIAAVPVTGIFTAMFYGVVFALVLKVAEQPGGIVWAIVGVAFVIGWIIQFVGHAFEGRRPALTVNLLQIFMAPPFLVAEILFAIGFERQLGETLLLRSVKYLPKKSN